MLAKDVMSTNPKTLPPTASLKEAAELMEAQDFGFVPIAENDRLVGAVTDRDLVVRGVAEGRDPNNTTLGEVMTKGIQYCFESDSEEEIANRMEKEQIRRLVVLTENKRLSGISLGDVATKVGDEKLSGEITYAVSEGCH